MHNFLYLSARGIHGFAAKDFISQGNDLLNRYNLFIRLGGGRNTVG
ncbi:MAG: hypothetical protein RL386_978 [Bacteroidota bacterium]|jgi:hypothetical protein